MPIFYFDFDEAGSLSRDYDGQEFADRAAMRAEALKTLSRLTMDVMPGGDRRDVIIDVRDEAGVIVFTASLSLTARWLEDRPVQEPGPS